jgi:hypothetical protein
MSNPPLLRQDGRRERQTSLDTPFNWSNALAEQAVDFDRVNRAALACLPAVLNRLLPGGKCIRGEFLARNPKRADRHAGSFKVNLRAGKWADFACDARGGDPVSLVAYLENVSQYEAAKLLSEMLGVR